MTRIAAFAALATFALMTCCQEAIAQQLPLVISDDTVGVLRAKQTGSLYLPQGTAPFPAVILIHGCGGVGPGMAQWAGRLTSWGYAALIIDSFSPRGINNVCNNGRRFPPRERVKDAFAAAAYLRGRSDIDSERLALIGFSHGGSTALAASLQPATDANGGEPFKAVIAYYPYCLMRTPLLATDLQILIGSDDDWTPAKRCTDMAALYNEASLRGPLLKVYPAAYHAFDVDRPARRYFGHHLAYDAAAATDSFEVTKQFLDSHLRPAASHE